jgi:hypothetical protein
VTYLWWAIDSFVIRRGRWFKGLSARREARLYNDWDLELTEAEAERENWEPDELPRPTSAARISGSSAG